MTAQVTKKAKTQETPPAQTTSPPLDPLAVVVKNWHGGRLPKVILPMIEVYLDEPVFVSDAMKRLMHTSKTLHDSVAHYLYKQIPLNMALLFESYSFIRLTPNAEMNLVPLSSFMVPKQTPKGVVSVLSIRHLKETVPPQVVELSEPEAFLGTVHSDPQQAAVIFNLARRTRQFFHETVNKYTLNELGPILTYLDDRTLRKVLWYRLKDGAISELNYVRENHWHDPKVCSAFYTNNARTMPIFMHWMATETDAQLGAFTDILNYFNDHPEFHHQVFTPVRVTISEDYHPDVRSIPLYGISAIAFLNDNASILVEFLQHPQKRIRDFAMQSTFIKLIAACKNPVNHASYFYGGRHKELDPITCQTDPDTGNNLAHYCVQYGNAEVLQRLKELKEPAFNALFQQTNANNETPLDLARRINPDLVDPATPPPPLPASLPAPDAMDDDELSD